VCVCVLLLLLLLLPAPQRTSLLSYARTARAPTRQYAHALHSLTQHTMRHSRPNLRLSLRRPTRGRVRRHPRLSSPQHTPHGHLQTTLMEFRKKLCTGALSHTHTMAAPPPQRACTATCHSDRCCAALCVLLLTGVCELIDAARSLSRVAEEAYLPLIQVCVGDTAAPPPPLTTLIPSLPPLPAHLSSLRPAGLRR